MRHTPALLVLWLLSSTALAQIPHIGDINFYGLHKVTREKILHATGIGPGEPLPGSKGDVEDIVEKLPDVVQARVEAICCDSDRAALFIGIEERGAPHAAFRSEPSGDAALPQALLDTYQRFLTAVARAAAHGDTSEDFTSGHSAMGDPQVNAFQTEFATYASTNLKTLAAVLHSCSEADQRTVAAAVIGYAPPGEDVADNLQYALDDPEVAVRANAIRALKAMAVYTSKQSPQTLRIAPTWLIELLHSVELSDRNEAAQALLILTDRDAQSVIGLIRERALPDLAEMARWPTLRYALPPFLLLGRVAGLTDAAAQQAWAKNDREPVIQKALGLDEAKAAKRARK